MLENISGYYKQLSPSVRYLSVTALFLFASGMVFLFLCLSKNAELQSVRVQVEEVERYIQNGRELQARCTLPTEAEKSLWHVLRDEYHKKIPPERKALELVREIAKTAHDCSIYDISFSLLNTSGDAAGSAERRATVVSPPRVISDAIFDAPAPGPDHESDTNLIRKNQFAINTSFHCTYRDLALFLEALSGLPRMLELTTLTIERKVPLMKVEMTINAFYAEEMVDA